MKKGTLVKILTGTHEGKNGRYIGENTYGWSVVQLDDGKQVARLPTEVEEVETVDITPSWPAVLHISLMVLDNHRASPEGKKGAMDNLTQMANVAQSHVDLLRNNHKVIGLSEDETQMLLGLLLVCPDETKMTKEAIDFVNKLKTYLQEE